MNSTKTSRVSKGEHLSEMFFTLLPHIYLTVLCHCLYYHCRSMICHYQCAPSNQCSLYLCLSILCLSFCSGADCLYVCFSASSMSPCVCVCVSSVSGASCQCPAFVYLRAAHLSSHHSYGSGQRCLCHSVPHQSDCSQLRQSPSVLLPLH